MQESIYEILLQLPLFQGLGRNELTDIVSKVKMDFRKYEHDKTVIKADTPCTELVFLIRGELIAERETPNHSLTFSEKLPAPAVIGIENIFGISQHHTRTYKTNSDVQMLFIAKSYLIQNMLPYEVCRFNFLNLLSASLQRQNKLLWDFPESDLVRRFTQILKNNFLKPSGEKHIKGKMVDWAEYMKVTRLAVSNMLNQLEQQKLIVLERKQITVPAMQDLVQYANEQNGIG